MISHVLAGRSIFLGVDLLEVILQLLFALLVAGGWLRRHAGRLETYG